MPVKNPLYQELIAPHQHSSRIFLSADQGRQLTYGGFVELAQRYATLLDRLGLQPGDRLMVQTPRRWECLALYAAGVQLGAVYVPLNPAYTAEETRYFIEDAAPRLMICEAARQAELETTARQTNTRLLSLEADGSGSLAEQVTGCEPRADTQSRTEEDLAALLYTSGTTGRPKGAMLTQGNLLSNARALVEAWEISASDCLLHALPIFHTHGLFVAINTSLLAGCRVRWLDGFNPGTVIDALPDVTLMMGVPTFYTRLLQDPRLDREATAGMRLFVSGSAPLLAETHQAFEVRTGHRILERYGLTEANIITSNPCQGERRAGTVGFPLRDVEISITDPETGEKLPAGQPGMIEARSPGIFKGYWKKPEQTREALRESGFFITGDLGFRDQEGYLHIVGRHKDLIISGGYNIYPAEIEAVLNQVPGVLESAAFGVPDADLGEVVAAALVVRADAEISDEQLAEAVASKLARYKHPRRYIHLDELPRNAMGKVQKNLLRLNHSG